MGLVLATAAGASFAISPPTPPRNGEGSISSHLGEGSNLSPGPSPKRGGEQYSPSSIGRGLGGRSKQPRDAADDFLASLNSGGDKEKPTKEPPIYVTAASFVFKLALVLGLAYVTILGLKKFGAPRGPTGLGGRRIRVIENSSLGANKSLHLVEVGSRKLLIASTPSQVNMLTELESSDVAEAEPVGPGPSGGFKEHLASFMGIKPDTAQSARSIAEIMRESSVYLQNKVREVGGFRGRYRNADTP